MNCRNCKSKIKKNLFSLGKISFTGKFPKNKKINIPKKFLNLSICENCTLVQLDRNFDKKYLYGNDYGYRTGLNKTMTNHVKSVVKSVEKQIKLKKNDKTLDSKFSRYLEALEIVSPLSFTGPKKGKIAFPSFKILVVIFNSGAPITENLIESPTPSKY